MIDRLRQMAIFAKTIDHGSFRGAAKELRLSPSVVSHHISQLEEYLGVALLYRSTRKLSLTREGERLLAATRKMLDAVEGELLDLTLSATEPSGELRVTAASVLSRSGLAEKLAAFVAANPRVQLSLDFSDSRRELIGDGYDIAIRMGPEAKPSATSRILFKVNRRLVASRAFLASEPRIEEPKDLVDRDWLALAPALNVPFAFRNGAKTQTIKPSVRVLSNDAQALYQLAREGAGYAVVPEFLADRDIADGVVAFPLPDWELKPLLVHANWPANAPKHGLVRLLLDALS